MNDIKYRYALDEFGETCSIDSVSRDNRYDHKYYCISCGKELKPRLGDKKAHHFYHPNSDSTCSGETYLHKLAKIKFKEKFDNSANFNVSFKRKIYCSALKECEFKSHNCYHLISEEFDLKKFYSKCDIESKIEHNGVTFIADLLLHNGIENDSKSTLIEVCVNHKSTDSKLNSGLRIIELQVTSESDIEEYINTGITETFDNSIKKSQVSFYGFDRISRKAYITNSRALSRFVLYRSGSAYVFNIGCEEQTRLYENDSQIEFNIYDESNEDIYVLGLLLARKHGINVKNCLLCKYYKGTEYLESFCAMSKNYGTPRHPKQQEAFHCKYYRENSEKLIIESNRTKAMIISKVD